MQHQTTAGVSGGEYPLSDGEIQRFSRSKALPYRSTAAVLHAIGHEYGSSFSVKVAGIYATENTDVPLSKVWLNDHDPVDCIRDSIDSELGIDATREEMEKCYTFLGLVRVAEKHINGNGKKIQR